MLSAISPGLLICLAALLIPLLQGKLRSAWSVLVPLLSLIDLCLRDQGVDGVIDMGAVTLTTVRLDTTALFFAVLFHVALIIGTIYAWHVDDPVQQVAALIYGGGAIGAALAGDLITLFVYWEVIAVASVFLVWARGTERAYASGQRYLIWQIVSGVLLLAGALMIYQDTGSLAFDRIGLEGPAGWLILLSFGIKAGFPLLHVWLVDAYPEATPTGTLFLSAFTTKLAVYALIRGFAGEELLIWIGSVMAIFPIFYAVIEDDLRRVLSYSMINQVGFMVVGVGLGDGWGVSGAMAHAFADVIFKGLLFMTMGAVLQQTGKVAASQLGGLYKTMPYTTVCCLIGALSISAFPLFSAFATKSLIVDGVAEAHLTGVWFILVFASAGVLHHAGIKIPFFAFFAHDQGLRTTEAPWGMRIAMGISALLCVAVGIYPWALYELLPTDLLMYHGEGLAVTDYQPYTLSHVVFQLQILCFAILAFVVLMVTDKHPPETPGTNLDADWVYRGPLKRGLRAAFDGPLAKLAKGFEHAALSGIPSRIEQLFMAPGPDGGKLARNWAMGSSVFAFLILLAGWLLLSA